MGDNATPAGGSESGHDAGYHEHGDEEHEHDSHDHEHDHEHDHHHHDLEELGIAVLTISSSRSIDEDSAGDTIIDIVTDAGHEVTIRELVADDYDKVQGTIDRFVDREDTDCVITTGGTGVTPDDVTVEALEPLLEKHLPGFGELFRRLSYDEIGTKVVGTRTAAGVADGVPVFCLPGSEDAVRLGTEEIIIEEAPHLAGLAKREEEADEGDDAEDDSDVDEGENADTEE
ncbi:MogA/MoaB family molybdenum cofactor biosynthesis protein [Natronomonas halophila]|uniref:MogA/MoaB family molybdenum cofactor biosynthesis protein n=1 Tax=Natronomonas halophila TaxID=2747817 RepID=UPI0015B66C2B|nr:MogA/MoaB family molybdenum cofactor biosynthesis protein [Natronomonas halophila]QLD84250.1 MogA/MoaB family molybdenum cofactor biosynthesis protein [Natronomonas halophila]